MEEEEEERGPGPPPGSGPDHMPSPAWSVLNNLMLRMTPQTPPPASSMQRGLGSAQQLPGRGRLPPEDPAPPPPGSEALLEDSAPPSAELEGPAPQPLEDMPTQSNSNVVAFLSQWADDNLCLIRNISTGMAVAGVMLFARSIKLTSRFVSPSDIPIEFIKNNVKLRGRLRRITEKGLELEHIPIYIPLISSWRKQPHGVLLVKLAGVELTEAGHQWLKEELKPYQILWFQLLATDNSSILCSLLINRGMYFNVSLNEEILRRGLGRTVLIKELNHNSKVYWTIHRNLLKAELKAIRGGKGIWKEETEKLSYIERFKGSWREIWRAEDNLFKRRPFWELNPKKASYYETLKSWCEKYKDKLSHSSFMLKVREFLSRVRLGKR